MFWRTLGLANFAMFEPDKKMPALRASTAFRYSGEGINLVQFAIEQQKGRPLDQLIQEALFTPLGMTRTGLIFRTEFADNVADRYDANEQFKSQTKRFPARGAGSMTTSAEDLARFVSALFSGRIIKPATRKSMLAPFIQIRSLHQFAVAADEPEGTEGPPSDCLRHGMGPAHTPRFGPAFFRRPWQGAQNYLIWLRAPSGVHDPATNSDNWRACVPAAARDRPQAHGHTVGMGELHAGLHRRERKPALAGALPFIPAASSPTTAHSSPAPGTPNRDATPDRVQSGCRRRVPACTR
jgi:hypothetical protein